MLAMLNSRRHSGAALAVQPFAGRSLGSHLYYLLECDYRDAGLRLQNRHRRGGYGQSTIDAGADPWRTRRHGRALTLGLNQSINLPFSVRTWASGTIALFARHGDVQPPAKLMVASDRDGATQQWIFKLCYGSGRITFSQWILAEPPLGDIQTTVSPSWVWPHSTWALIGVSWGPLGSRMTVNQSLVASEAYDAPMRNGGDVVRVHSGDGTLLATGLDIAWLAVFKGIETYPEQLAQMLSGRLTMPDAPYVPEE